MSPYAELAKRGFRTVEVEPGTVAVLADDCEIARVSRRGLRRFAEFEVSAFPALSASTDPVDDCGADLPLGELMCTPDMV
ncbi:MAG: hypothetical protein AAGM22_23685 [Acidobacteriota bacterium]